MELKPGEKQGDVGVIPEEWDAVPLGRMAKLQGGYAFRSDDFSDSGVPVVRISDIQDGVVDINGAICHPPTKLSDDFVVRQGDVLVAMSGATTGKVGLFRHSTPAYQNQRVGKFVVRDKNRTSPGFIEQLVRSSVFVSRLGVFLEQGAQPNISGSQIESLVFAAPRDVGEQRAIAAALSDVDELIGSFDRLIAKKRGLKQAAMQQLLTGQSRLPGFTGKWSITTLGSLGAFSKGKGIRKDDVLREGLPCVRYGEIYTHHNDVIRSFRSFISRDVARESRRLRAGDLVFACSGETAEDIGKCVAFLGDEEAYVGGDTVILSLAGHDPRYLGYLLNHPSVAAQKARMGQGDAVVHINAQNLASLTISIPDEEEQRAIGGAFADMDAEIAALEQRREKTRLLKQGMMQELLTGRTRLL